MGSCWAMKGGLSSSEREALKKVASGARLGVWWRMRQAGELLKRFSADFWVDFGMVILCREPSSAFVLAHSISRDRAYVHQEKEAESCILSLCSTDWISSCPLHV